MGSTLFSLDLCKAFKDWFALTKRLSPLEKCLAACASGSWMLSPSYLEESEKENRFLAETGFEWSAARDSAAMAVGKDRECIEAGSRWRIKLQNYMRNGKQRGSFQNWVVLLVVDEKKKKGFVSVLEAGLATVYTDKAMAAGDVEVWNLLSNSFLVYSLLCRDESYRCREMEPGNRKVKV
jgi:hypothetical protein